MITVLIEEGPKALNALWLDTERGFKLKVVPEGIIVSFRSEPESQKVELHFHPSMLYMLAEYAKSQPANTFMAKEGKEEMLAEMAAFDKQYNESLVPFPSSIPAPPF